MQFGNKDHFKELLVISSVIFTAETIFENFLLIYKPKTFMAQFFKIQIVDFVNFLFGTKNDLRNPQFPPRLSGDLLCHCMWMPYSHNNKIEHG